MLRHWRGEDSLGIAYWRNSVLFASGLIYTSGIATVSKQAIVAAFDQLGLH
jgi:hypothetical protein